VSGPAVRRDWSVPLALLLLVILAAALRLYRLGSNSLWVDEFVTVRTASLSLTQIIGENIRNQSFEPPLYFWLIHWILQTFGGSETILRFPSAVAGTLTVPVLWLLTREVTGRGAAAWLSAGLLTLNPLHLWYSQEARPYALLILFSGLAMLSLARAARGNDRAAWFAFAAWTLVAVFTHAVALLLLGVAWTWALLTRNRRQVIPLVATSALVLACTAPLGFAIAQASAELPGNGSPTRAVEGLEVPYTLFTYVGGYSFGPSLREIQNRGPAAALEAHPAETGIAVATLMALAVLLLRKPWPPAVTPLFLLYVGLAFAAALATGKAYNVRYTLPGLLGFLGVTAAAVVRTSPPIRLAWATVLLVLFAWSDAQWFFSPIYSKDDSRALVQWLGERLPRGSAVEVAPGYVTGVLSYYAKRDAVDLRFAPDDGGVDSTHAAGVVLTRLHHVVDPASVKEGFRRAIGRAFQEDTVGGYLVLTAPRGTSAGASSAPQ
jgi:mannosyltransferase